MKCSLRSLRVVSFLVAIALGMLVTRWVSADNYTIDSSHSSVIFKVKHMNASYTWGRFNGLKGKMTLDTDAPSIELAVRTENVDTNNSQRDQHLKGPDYFNAKQFPEITFKSTSIKKADGDKYDVDGTLSLHGVSKPLKVVLERTGDSRGPMGAVSGFETTFEIKRSDFGMPEQSGAGDIVRLYISMECGKR